MKLFKDSFIHDQCEPDVKARGFTTEKQVVCRIEGQPGDDYLVTIFPRKADEPHPQVTPWCGESGVKLTWNGETHYVLLAMTPQTIKADGIAATASALVVKVKDRKNFTISLPAGGSVKFNGKNVKSDNSIELQVIDGKVQVTAGKDLLPKP